uniref:PH domain-containing protein n=1 Tax=Chromera velia CCMP2878 TaxID=1169474 RepID=A0A0G4I0B4_9ALVE|eukprot:Cvel_9907.t1-p1 / transcript=Cvel_9907.t1 / gene=Cvel_9907 / organism=Chromera_velia_CCMP2878 / gene_product=hypothetical protein / transcript_product=hypothetical protein / location=Cvel_scaffold585:1944-3846(+) / protein_length=86 / sequence_SO=supercontig / SO=protein_coding / is_pseudo=false
MPPINRSFEFEAASAEESADWGNTIQKAKDAVGYAAGAAQPYQVPHPGQSADQAMGDVLDSDSGDNDAEKGEDMVTDAEGGRSNAT